jgi:hypothetical protein
VPLVNNDKWIITNKLKTQPCNNRSEKIQKMQSPRMDGLSDFGQLIFPLSIPGSL